MEPWPRPAVDRWSLFGDSTPSMASSSLLPGSSPLLVVHGAGYEYLVGEPDSRNGTSLALRCAELDWISLLDGGEALTLWQDISARRKARRRSEVMVFSQLDEFELYRSHRRTYYISDEAPPDGLTIEPGTGLSLRTAVARKYHPHPAMRENGRMTSASGAYAGEGVPIYADIGRLGRQPALLVEGLPINVWILVPVQNDGGRRFDFPLVAQIADGLAYWVWQFTPALTLIFEELGWTQGRLAIHVQAQDDLTAAEDAAAHEDPFVTTDLENRALKVLVTRSAVSLLMAADNRGERELMRSVIKGFRAFGPSDSVVLVDERVDSMIDRHAPLGHKKHFFFLSVDTSPDLDGSELSHHRGLQEADVEGVLDDLGEHLRTAIGLPLGPIDAANRASVLKGAVADFYRWLEREVAALSAEALLEYLIARHESTIYESALRALTVPTRVACFNSVPEMIATLREEVPRLARASIASRFLIEYVATVLPSGKQAPRTRHVRPFAGNRTPHSKFRLYQ